MTTKERIVLHSGVQVRARVSLPVRPANTGLQYDAEIVTFAGFEDDLEHIALVFRPHAPTPLVRVHSECLTGDVFGSARCDCGPQLHESLALLGERGGVLLYMRQEGRGIGLYNKVDAYKLQIVQGLDTFEANRALNFEEDLRDFTPAAEILKSLGFYSISLITNNPDKVAQLSECGIHVEEVVPTGVFMTDCNRGYLQAKTRHHHHDIELEGGRK